jgi:hypothetical protein
MSSTQQLLLGEGAGGAAPVYIEDVFSTWLYAGNSSTQTITNGIDLSTKGGLVWIKRRNGTVRDHYLNDTIQGADNFLISNKTDATQTVVPSVLTAFNTNGFNLNSNDIANGTGFSYVSWTFREQPKFFDVVTFTSDASNTNQRISHNLGSTPGCIFVKKTSGADGWFVWHRSYASATNNYQFLNTTAVVATSANIWGSTGPSSTDFGINTTVFGGSATFVAYLFAHDAGGFGAAGTDNVISCGSYTGTGSTLTVTLGYEVQWLLVKRANGATATWILMDVMRGLSYTDAAQLSPNTTGAENNAGVQCNPIATGFEITSTGSNLNNPGNTYIYIAIRRGPMAVPTLGTSVFAVNSLNAPPYPSWISNFPVDMAIMRYNANTTDDPQTGSRLVGAQQLLTPQTAAETANSDFDFDYNNGWGLRSGTVANWYSWMFRRAPSYFDVVCYTGAFPSNVTVNHNLGVTPEFIITKSRSTAGYDWRCYHSALGISTTIRLNLTNAAAAGTQYVSVSSTNFVVGNSGDTDNNGTTYVSYLFATCAGVSKVGSYTGTGATQTIACGFTGGARFVLVKATSTTGNWYFWDSFRGIVAGNDPYLTLNTTAAEVTGTDWVDTAATGFELSNAGGNLANSSGVSYIFLAIA